MHTRNLCRITTIQVRALTIYWLMGMVFDWVILMIIPRW